MNLKSLFRSRIFAILAISAVIGFIGIQFVRPELKNPPVTANLKAPPEVEQILRSHCYNCHSNETKLAWFDQIVPAYWLVARDVKQARERLNFSELGRLPVAQQNAELFEAVHQIRFDAMPPRSYRAAHPEAVIGPGELTVLETYLKTLESHKASDSKAISAAAEEYAKWAVSNAPAVKVQPAANGIEFPVGYKNWRVVSSTDREDNHTIRQILGNDIAVKAIAAGQIHPWPDGSIFAKVAWDKLIDAQGVVHTGQFKQVEFMIKDSRKHADTLGWGFARWLGMGLQPFGKDASFTTSCVGCHAPLRANDFVFTQPLKTQL